MNKLKFSMPQEAPMPRQAKIAEGSYPYRIVDIQIFSNYMTSRGVRDKVSFKFELTIEGQVVPFTQSLFYSESPNSPYVNFMMMLCECYQTSDISEEKLIGTQGSLYLIHVPDQNGNVFENIFDLQPDLSQPEVL